MRGEAPLLDAYLRRARRRRRALHHPRAQAERRRSGGSSPGDVPLHGGLDSIALTGGVLVEAERRAAALWGADVARFSVGGLDPRQPGAGPRRRPARRPGRRARARCTARCCSGWSSPASNPSGSPPASTRRPGCRSAAGAADVEQCLREHPDVVAVFVGDPTYVGTVGELAEVADLVHAAGLPLLVDAAWGAHFGFHPALPAHALQAGADALVTSAHKMLPAYSQAALVLARTERLDPARLQSAFDATHTTSPAGAVLASIDAARALLQLDGEAQLDRPVRLVAAARARLARGRPG